MNNTDLLKERLREVDPAVGIDRSPDGPTGRRIYSEARRRVEAAPAAQELRRGVLRHPSAPTRIRRRSLALGAILAVAAIALAVVPDLLSDTPAYAIRPLPNGVIVIDWSDWDSFAPNASAVAADLREYGVDVEITTIAASPSAVGGVTASFPRPGEGGPLPQGLTIGKEGTPDGLTWTIDPTVFHGPVTLEVAVPAHEGEQYVSRASVFEPGEVLGGLQCALGEPLRAVDVAARLSDLGITPVWYVTGPMTDVTADGYYTEEHQVAEVPDGVILWGYALSEATVEFTVAPDGTPLSEYPEATLWDSDVPCTPGRAAAWK